MTSDELTASGSGIAGKTKVPPSAQPPFDTTVAHQARVYDYLLGRKIHVVHTPESA
jgi:hypothetical protein